MRTKRKGWSVLGGFTSMPTTEKLANCGSRRSPRFPAIPVTTTVGLAVSIRNLVFRVSRAGWSGLGCLRGLGRSRCWSRRSWCWLGGGPRRSRHGHSPLGRGRCEVSLVQIGFSFLIESLQRILRLLLDQGCLDLIVHLRQRLNVLGSYLINVVTVCFDKNLRDLPHVQIKRRAVVHWYLCPSQLSDVGFRRRALQAGHFVGILLQLLEVFTIGGALADGVRFFLHRVFVIFSNLFRLGCVFLLVLFLVVAWIVD